MPKFTLPALLLLICCSSALAQSPAGTAFTYQGRLDSGGSPLDETADFEFTLWDAESGGTQIATAVRVDSVVVADGLFTAGIDFGDGAFPGDARWLEIAVRSPHDPADSEPFTPLAPRQALNPAPYAQHALAGGGETHWDLVGDALTNTNGGFVGINRSTPVTGAEVFGIFRDTDSYGGMYMETGGPLSRPFYGYRTSDKSAWSYLDGQTGDWRLWNGTERLIVTNTGNVAIGVSNPTEMLQVGGVIYSTTGGFKFPDGSVQSSAAVGGGGNTLDAAYDQGGPGAGRAIDAADGPVEINGAGGLKVVGGLGLGGYSPGVPGLNLLQGADASNEGISISNSSLSQGLRLWVDGGDVAHVDNGPAGAARLALNAGGGDVGIATADPQAQLHVATGTDVGPASGGYLITGSLSGQNVGLDNNELMARNNGVPSTLFVNLDGGPIILNGNATPEVGIGTNLPRAELEVDGGILVGGTGRDISWPPGESLQIGTYDGSTFHKLAQAGETSLGAGSFSTYGPSGVANVSLTQLVAAPENGYISVKNATGSDRAGMYVDGNGDGIVWGTTKNFREPSLSEPGQDIWYASVEGPEAAAYIRGTALLVNGAATVALPTHFRDVAISEGLTVQLTPRSASSEGLAVVAQSTASFQVRELRSGTGSYEFHWEVKAVRRGQEDYRVLRPSGELSTGPAPENHN